MTPLAVSYSMTHSSEDYNMNELIPMLISFQMKSIEPVSGVRMRISESGLSVCTINQRWALPRCSVELAGAAIVTTKKNPSNAEWISEDWVDRCCRTWLDDVVTQWEWEAIINIIRDEKPKMLPMNRFVILVYVVWRAKKKKKKKRHTCIHKRLCSGCGHGQMVYIV